MKTPNAFFSSLIAFVLIGLTSNAQDIVWASKVINVTSEVGKTKYSAQMALGKPNTTPDSTGNGWQPVGSGKEESIVVGFDKTIPVHKVLIVESMHTGFIRRVYVIDADGNEYQVAHFTPKSGSKGTKLIQIDASEFSIKATAVKVVLVPIKNVSTTIDAIGITAASDKYMIDKMHQVVAME